MGKTIKSHMIRWNLMMILLVTVCISGLHMYHIYRYTVRMNQEEMATMSKQAQNSLNHMLNPVGCASVSDHGEPGPVGGI